MPESFSTAVLVGCLTTFSVCVLLLLTRKWHGQLTFDHFSGIQKFHATPTPRVGGVAMMAGLIAGWSQLPESSHEVVGYLILAALPAFIAGTLEDITQKIGVKTRFWSSLATGLIACGLFNISLTRLNIWGVDALLAWTPLSVAITVFAISGVINAMNVIDGFNGLASGVGLICLAALGLIAGHCGDSLLAGVCALLFGVTLGFGLLNFPQGKIFLGDGGAYLLGFWLAWIAVLLPVRNTSVSSWAGLLICSYPVIEVLYSIYRRRLKNRETTQADRQHLHSLIHTEIIRKQFSHWPGVYQNSAVAPQAWLLTCPAVILAVVFFDNTAVLVIGFFFSFLIYWLAYRRVSEGSDAVFSGHLPTSKTEQCRGEHVDAHTEP